MPAHLRSLHGGKTEISLRQDLAKAYRRYADLYQVEDNITLMQELFDRYRLEVVPEHASENTRKSKNLSLERLRAALGENPIAVMNPQVIYKYRDYIGRTRSKKHANLDLEVLSHCFTKAIEWGLTSDHPMTNKKVVKFSLPGRDRYVEDWELQEWASVANPFLVAYVVLKGATGLRQQDLLRLQKKDISQTELVSTSLKTGKKVRFPLYTEDGEPTTVRQALDVVEAYFEQENSKRRRPVISPWLFHNRKGESYYDLETRSASGFQSVWQRSMKKALEETRLEERFTEHDLRAKVGSDLETDLQASQLLAHSSTQLTRQHYRRRGQTATPAPGFTIKESKA
ncbi:Integrase [Pseudohaliea rubra DSM 19751]|uniref:Integrase n=1 Tax=Pseudohaliea rubra DSM 19751 TaxID=1265313 RepID=A0A095VNE5_9GAMM|nr:Integrase [Pseudohaliea rubra DSM 19751]